MYARPNQWSQNSPTEFNPGARHIGGAGPEQARQQGYPYPGPRYEGPPGSSRSSTHSSQHQPGSPMNAFAPPLPARPPPRIQEVSEGPSSLPYLQSQTPAPSVMRPPPPQAPPQFPRFIPPPSPNFPSPMSSPGSPGMMTPPPVDYLAQALSVVGGYPVPKREDPAPYPVMMRPNQSPGLPRGAMPVEAVMARYGQALPDEPIRPRPMSNPPPHPAHHRLMRPPPNRRAQTELPAQIQQPALPKEEPQRAESPKRPVSMLRKLTKKRPVSAPLVEGRAKADPRFPNRPEILPDVLFHVRASQDYEMQSYDELSFSIGAIIAVKSAPEEGKWTGYIVNSSAPRVDGIFYRTFVSIMRRTDSSQANGNILFLVEAVYNYRAMREDEFDFVAGDRIAVYSTPSGSLWVGANQQARAPSRGRLFPWKLVAPL